jgi:integrase
VRTFLDRCAQHRLGALFEVAVLTGLRRGEITGLRWSDVDLVARKVVVRRNRVTVNGRVQEQKAPKDQGRAPHRGAVRLRYRHTAGLVITAGRGSRERC